MIEEEESLTCAVLFWTTVNYVCCEVPYELNLLGDSIKLFPTITALEPNEANSITLSYVYTIQPETTAGLNKTRIEF